MTPDAALDQLRAQGDPDRAAQMHAYHKIDRPYLGLCNAVTGDLATAWRKTCDAQALVPLAQGLWDSNIFEARIAAAKLFVQARMRPDDAAAWACITGWLPEFDSWAIADAVAQSGAKRVLQDPQRLDQIAPWTTSDHLWTKRAALVFTLPFTRSRHLKPVETAARNRILNWCAGYADDPEWFIQKAVAWWLRDLSKRDPDRVAAWLTTHGDRLKPFARKEAARHLP
jgi:3-methyladenine DNA glycosylase AlkD